MGGQVKAVPLLPARSFEPSVRAVERRKTAEIKQECPVSMCRKVNYSQECENGTLSGSVELIGDCSKSYNQPFPLSSWYVDSFAFHWPVRATQT